METNSVKNLGAICDIIEQLDKFRSELYELYDNMANDYEADINDVSNMYRIGDRLTSFRYQILVYMDFRLLIAEIDNQKDRFTVQKKAQFHLEHFKEEVDSLISISRTWRFTDYRCKAYQSRMEKIFLELQEKITSE